MSIRIFWTVASAAAVLSTASVEGATYTSFDIPGADGFVAPSSLSEDGFVCGSFADPDGNGHAFIRAADGTITTFDVPGSSYTDCSDINEKHEAVGDYTVGGGGIGYTRSPTGHFSTFAVTGAFGTFAGSISAKRSVSGYYEDSNRQPLGGFIRNREGDIETFYIPDKTYGPVVGGINKQGTVTGDFVDFNGYHGFVRQMDGSLTTYDIPNTESIESYLINDKGFVAGEAADANTSATFAFLRAPDGNTTTFSIRGQNATYAFGLNNHNEIVGTYGSPGGSGSHGYLRTHSGKIRRIDYPGEPYTVVSAINDAGEIVGYYIDSGGIYHGFLRAP